MEAQRRKWANRIVIGVSAVTFVVIGMMFAQYGKLLHDNNLGKKNKDKFSLEKIGETFPWWIELNSTKEKNNGTPKDERGGIATSAGTQHFNMSKLFEEHLKRYKESLESLKSNLSYQFVFMLLGLLTIVTKTEKYKFPIVEVEVENTSAFSFVMCACLLFLWLTFGFTTQTVISDRFRLHVLAAALDGKEITSKTEAAETGSVQNLVADGGMFDSWFTQFSGLPWQATDRPGSFFIMIFVALFIGVSNGCMVALAWRACMIAKAKRPLVGFFAVWVTLLATHIGFFGVLDLDTGNHNENFMQPVALLVSLFTLAMIHRFILRKGDASVSQNNKDERISAECAAIREIITVLEKRVGHLEKEGTTKPV